MLYNLMCDVTNEIKLQVNQIHRRPYLKVRLIDGTETQGLYDTGADVSCIDAKTFAKLRSTRLQFSEKKISAVFRAANGEPLVIDGRFQLDVQVNDKNLSHDFYVVKNLNEPVILGIDFIEKHGLKYCPVDKTFSWKGQSTWNKGVLKMTRAEMLAPLSVSVCKVQLRTECGSRPGPKEDLMVNIGHVSNPFLTGGPYLVQPDADGNVQIPIYNCAPIEIQLERNEFVGQAENISTFEKRELNPAYLSAISANDSRTRATPLSPEKEKFIKETIRLTVPAEYQDRYLAMILKHH